MYFQEFQQQLRLRYDPTCDEYHEDHDESKDCAHNNWELYRMPIKASYCDDWWTACKDDKFCAADGGPGLRVIHSM